MIFAHGPFGFLVTCLQSPLWKKWSIDKRLIHILLVVGFIGGIFPDVDLFYYYLIDASVSHREFITHTPFLYCMIALVGGSVLFALKKRRAVLLLLTFCIGAVSHTVSDMIVAELRFLYPFSDQFYGVSSLNIEALSSNSLFLNFLFEGICFTFFFYMLIRLFVHATTLRIVLVTVLMLTFTLGVAGLSIGNAHIYHPPHGLRYDDIDGDGIYNYQDDDIDGDGIENSADLDSDGDNESNVYEIATHAERFFGVWYDPTDGGIIQIPSRLGLVTNVDSVRRLYETVGIHFYTEMKADYMLDSNGYITPPTDEHFDRTSANYYAWFDHQGWLEEGDTLAAGRNQIGDVLFFTSGYVAVVTGFTNTGAALVLDVHKEYPVQEQLVDAIIEREGEILSRAKILDSSPLFSQD